ncbi:type II secretion system F family protein [Uliginosibacterium sp. sgz301328]|uniref:type II secretion system F family protein n=1 Tax=Uliginosibacterium sp. sgz301328 TaxID=3243764 RepID=UPI00359CE0A2
MPDYVFKAAAPGGHTESGTITAADMVSAMAALEDRHLTVFDLKDASAATPVGHNWRRPSVTHAARVVLVRELSTLANAGISLADALSTLRDANRETALYGPLGVMVRSIHSGETFSSALEKAALGLPEYVLAMVRAGEATGNLGVALSRAADQMDFDARMRAQTREAMVYPSILIGTGTMAVLFIFAFVVPRFATLLRGRLDTLPWMSVVVLRTGAFFNAYFIESIVAIALLVAGVVAAARNPRLRVRLLASAAHLPVIGEWIHSGETARWTTGLSMLLQSKVGILPALELAASSVRLSTTTAKLRNLRAEVNRGRRLSQAIEHQRLLEPTSLSMVRVGEQSGELGPMLEHVAHYWNDKNQSMQRRVVSLIEPASILCLGAVIGFVMVGVVLAMASLSDVKF